MDKLADEISTSEKQLFVGLAGPGTGKSTTFKTIVESDSFKNKRILILSFINKLVNDLSNDFRGYDNVTVLTLHSFALAKFKEFVSGADITLEEELDDLVSEDQRFIKEEKVDYKQNLYEGGLSSDEETFYKARSKFYGGSLKLYSFNSIIYAVNRLFSEKEDKIPNDYDLILVDEFQDFNQLEYNLINHLNKKNKVVIVGDDDQSLYGWKNAKPDLIRNLYDHEDNDNFTLDYCYRCPVVIINAVNSLIKNATDKGFLNDRTHTPFLCPTNLSEKKIEINNKYPKIDFLSGVKGDKLIYQLSERIQSDMGGDRDNRILLITPSHLKQSVQEGLLKKGFHVVEFELFANEERNKMKHRKIIEAFTVLAKRKTDNLALRKILGLYLGNDELKTLVCNSDKNNKSLWNSLEEGTKRKIESDIELFKKARAGKKLLSDSELLRVNEIFNLKNLISKMIRGFNHVQKGSAELEMTTTMSSKGLSADFVYYLGIDDRDMLKRETGKLSNQKICEFLVGMTRAKKKLTLIALESSNPKIFEFVDKSYINSLAS